jgi:SNF2 family DNA or RNA helicase
VLVFTQFTEMGDILRAHVQETFAREALYLHGGVGRKARDELVRRFQDPAGPRVFVLSLKAGGTGLNLTAASHVVHFDRWWNPAVEDQATDRAFRIGQTRTVLVHKFVCAGTVEEKIDGMIDAKKAVAGKVVGTGEQWLTELGDRALKDVLRLSADAVEE